MKGQFVWKRLERRENESLDDFEERISCTYKERPLLYHRMICNKEYECVATMALMVFVGMALNYGFQKFRIVEYLEINDRIYNELLDRYNKYSEIARKKAELHILDFTTPAGRLYLKTSLIRNSLRYHGLLV